MARIAGVAPRGLFLRFVFWYARRKLGRDTEVLGVVGHQPTILNAVGAYEMMLERARLVDARLKALASIKAATLVGCVF